MVLDFSGAKRLEMECQILTMALRQSWSSRDPVGTVNAAGILNEIFPDLVSEYSANPNPSDFYQLLELNPDAGPMVIRKAYHYAIRRFLRENKGSALRRKRTDFFRVLDAGIVMRKSRLRLSHDLAVLRAQLISNRIIGGDGVFVLSGRTKDETQVGKEIPEILEKLISRKVIGHSEARAILNQMVLFPNISCRDLIISAGYVTEQELDILIEATQSEATGQFEKLQLATSPHISSHSPSPLVAHSPPAAQAQSAEVDDQNSQPASRQTQSQSGALSAPRPPGQQGLAAPRPPSQDKPLSAPRSPSKEALSAPRSPSEMAKDAPEPPEAPKSQDGESLASALSPGLLARAMAASQPPDSLSAALSPEVLKKALIESQSQIPVAQAPITPAPASDSLGGQLSTGFLEKAEREAQAASQPQAVQPSAFMSPWTSSPVAQSETPAPAEQPRDKWAAPSAQAETPVLPQPSTESGPGEPAKSEQLFSSPFEVWEMPKEPEEQQLVAEEPINHSQGAPFSALIKPEEPPAEEPPKEPSKLFVSDESVAQYTPKSIFSQPTEPGLSIGTDSEPLPVVEPERSQLQPHQRFPEPDEPATPETGDAGIIVDATPLKVPVPPQLEFSAGVSATTPAKVSPRPSSNLNEAEKLKKFLDDEAKVKAARAKIREREERQIAEEAEAWQRDQLAARERAAGEAPAMQPQAPQEAPQVVPSGEEVFDEEKPAEKPAQSAFKDWTQMPNVSTQPPQSGQGTESSGGMPLLDWGEPEDISLDVPSTNEPPPIENAPSIDEPAPAEIQASSDFDFPDEEFGMVGDQDQNAGAAPLSVSAAQANDEYQANAEFASGIEFNAQAQSEEASGISFNEVPNSGNDFELETQSNSGIEFNSAQLEPEPTSGIDFNAVPVEEAQPAAPVPALPPAAPVASSAGEESTPLFVDQPAETPPPAPPAQDPSQTISAAPAEETPSEPPKTDSIISKPSFLTPPPSFLSQPPSFLTPPASIRGKKAEPEGAKTAEAPPQQPSAEVSAVAPIKESAQQSIIEKKATSLDEENDLALHLMMIAGLVTNQQAEELEKKIVAGEGDSVYTLAVSSGYATSTEIAIVRRAEDLLTALSQDRKGGS